MFWPLAILAAYLAGSVPFGLIIGRFRGIDIREHGSKNIGATNVGRVLGKKAGGLCFALDFLKGALPVVIVGLLATAGEGDIMLLGAPIEAMTASQMILWLGVAVATIIGHMYSPFIGFGGGKGVATAFGALVAMWPMMTLPALGAFAVWAVVVRVTRYVAVASMVAALAVPVLLALWLVGDGANAFNNLLHAWPPLLLAILLALLVIYKHRTNIARLRRGEEPKLGQKLHRRDAESAEENQK